MNPPVLDSRDLTYTVGVFHNLCARSPSSAAYRRRSDDGNPLLERLGSRTCETSTCQAPPLFLHARHATDSSATARSPPPAASTRTPPVVRCAHCVSSSADTCLVPNHVNLSVSARLPPLTRRLVRPSSSSAPAVSLQAVYHIYCVYSSEGARPPPLPCRFEYPRLSSAPTCPLE